MTRRSAVVATAVAVAWLSQAGCWSAREAATAPAPAPSAPQPEPPDDAPCVVVSKEAEAEMRERGKGRTVRWLIVYHGTCSDAPALGIYARERDVPRDAVEARARGFDFALTREVADLLDEWGSVIVECPAGYHSKWLSARFADKERAE